MNITGLWTKIKAWLKTEAGHTLAIIIILILSNLWSFYLGTRSVGNTVNLEQIESIEGDYSLADPEILKEGSLAAAIAGSASVSPKNGPETGSAVQNGEDSAPMYVASKNGRVYYFTWCAGAKRILEENRIYFQTSAAAQSAGLKPSTACEGLD